MSREIKARAWHKKEKKMYYSGTFNALMTNGVSHCSYLSFTFDTPEKEIVGHDKDTDAPIYEHYVEVMLFTGLTDKDGNDIYEGEILGLDDPEDKSICTIVFENGSFVKRYDVTNDPHQKENVSPVFTASWNFVDAEIWKVVGNIYENPELLNAK